MSERAFRAVTHVSLLALLVGCGGAGRGEKIVAEAGDLQVTLTEFHDAYNQISPANRPDISTEEGRRAFANDLLNKEIVLAEARRMEVDPGIQATVDQTVLQKALEKLYRTEVAEKVEVGGEDVAEVYEKRKFNVVGAHILVEDLAEAEKVLEEIRSGKTPFERAVEKYSLDRATREKGGRMTEIAWSMALPDFQAELFAMEPGETKALEGTIGGHVLRLIERVPKELGTMEEARQTLRSDVRQQLEAVRLREYMEDLEAKAGLTWHDEGVALCAELMRRNAAVDPGTVPAEDRNVLVATDEEKGVVIASFSGRDWTVGDYIEYLRKAAPGQRPPGVLPKRSVRELIRGTLVRDELLRAEAYARGLDQDPAILAARDRQMEELLVDQVVYRFLQATNVKEEEARAAYDSTLAASPEALLVPETVDLMLLVNTDSTVVAQGLARIAAGEDEAKVIKELSVDFRSAIRGGRTGPFRRGTYATELEDVAFTAKPGGGWSKPIVTPTGTGALRVVERTDAHTATFDELKERLTTAMVRSRGEKAFEDWLQAERDRLGVTFHDDVLAEATQAPS